MTIPYTLRLICVSMTSFVAVFALVGWAVSLTVPAALRATEHMRACEAARLALWLRLIPAAASAFLVLAVCVPSYVRFEERGGLERAGLPCLALAALGLAGTCASVGRVAFAWRRSRNPATTFALVGIVRPRIQVSEAAKKALTPSQLELALSHEQAHAWARDNWKRLFILLAPAPFPHFEKLENAWKRYSEYAADDRAVDDNPYRALSLAAALVQVAKLGPSTEAALVTNFLASGRELEARVNRLLNPGTAKGGNFPISVRIAPAILMLALLADPARVHSVLEWMMR